MNQNYKNILLFFTLAFITLIPFLFWSNNYMVGGDDSRLYYIYPKEYLINFVTKFISKNQPGSLGNYFSQAYIFPFVYLLSIIKESFPYLNLQKLFLGLNLGSSFIFFYLFLSVFLKNKYSFYSKYLFSIFYSFSIFSYYTVWQHQLFPVYLTSYFPLIFYLFSKAILFKKFKLILFLSLSTVLYSFTLYSIPWIMATIISCSPVFLYLFFENKKIFTKYTSFLFLSIFLLNFYWLFNMLYSPFSSSNSTDVTSNIIDSNFIKDNANNIFAVAKNNQILYSFSNLYQKKIQEDFSWPTFKTYEKEYLYLLIPNLSLVLLIILAGIFLKDKKINVKKKYLIALISFLISVYFFTVNIGSYGLNIFIWMNNHLPGFTMFRNMEDKFGIAMAFNFSFVLAMSFDILLNKISKQIGKKIFIYLFLILIILNSKPFIFGSFFKINYSNTNQFNNLNQMDNSFLKLKEYVDKENYNSRIIWLPLNTANYTIVPDQKNKDFFYMGVSPIGLLTKSNDFNGMLSFNKDQSKAIENSFYNKNYDLSGEIFRQLNVEYIVLNKTINSNLINSYLYTQSNKGDFYNIQDGLIDAVLGKKIIDFDQNYSIYNIKEKYKNKKIYLTSNKNEFPNSFENLSFYKIKDYDYRIKINDFEKNNYLVFLDPYHRLWQLEFNGKPIKQIENSQEKVWDYANVWDLSSLSNNYKSDTELKLYFKGADYVFYSRFVSLISLVILLSLLLLTKSKKNVN